MTMFAFLRTKTVLKRRLFRKSYVPSDSVPITLTSMFDNQKNTGNGGVLRISEVLNLDKKLLITMLA